MPNTISDVTAAWLAAERNADPAALAAFLADDFFNVGPVGFVLDKAAYVARYASGDLKCKRYEFDDATIRHYGDTAVAIGTSHIEMVWRDQPRQGVYRATQVYAKLDGEWKLASMHTSQIPEEHQ